VLRTISHSLPSQLYVLERSIPSSSRIHPIPLKFSLLVGSKDHCGKFFAKGKHLCVTLLEGSVSIYESSRWLCRFCCRFVDQAPRTGGSSILPAHFKERGASEDRLIWRGRLQTEVSGTFLARATVRVPSTHHSATKDGRISMQVCKYCMQITNN
jgi:hypothetical protein